MQVVVCGVNHRTAPIELRERLALDATTVGAALTRMRMAAEWQELAVLSTCNRTELYAVVADGVSPDAASRALFAQLTGVHEFELEHVHVASGAAAALHLMRVASGLDSQVLGEHQILGQVKNAHTLARTAGTLGPVLDRMFGNALHAAKRVHAETLVGYGAVSVASAGIVLGERMVGALAGKRALVIGAGETGTLAARHLAKRELAALYVANRTPSVAAALASVVGGEAVSLEDVPRLLADVDLVVCATSAGRHVVTAGMVRAARAAGGERPLVLVDLAMPRNVDPAAAASDVFVYALDALSAVVRDSLAQRQREAQRAEAILAEETRTFGTWLRGRAAVPLVRELHAHFERLRADEVGRSTKHCSAEERAQIEQLTRSLVSKLLQAPTVRLTTVDPEATSGLCWADAVRGLFAIGSAAHTEGLERGC